MGRVYLILYVFRLNLGDILIESPRKKRNITWTRAAAESLLRGRALHERQSKSSRDPVDVQIGAKLRELRLARGLVQSELAEVAGVTFQQVYKYETGRQRVSAAMLYYFARRLGVQMDDFFEELPRSSMARRSHH